MSDIEELPTWVRDNQDDCARYGVDLEAEYERKIAYNRTREFRHGGKLL